LAAPFKLLIDTPQQRIKTTQPNGPILESLSTLCAAQDWDIAASTNCYLDGVSGTVFLTPGPKMANWIGTNTGPTSKIDISAITLDDSANWIPNLLITGDCPFYSYKAANTGSGVGGVTTTSFSANQGMFVEWFQDQSNANPNGVFNCGWNSSATGTTGTSLRFYGDGGFEVWLDGTLLGTYSIAGKSAEYGQTDKVLTGQSGPQYIGVMLIPFRERELLVLSTQGGGAVHIFDSIPEGTPSPVITQATNFWFYVPGGSDTPTTPNVRVSVLQYASSGSLVGKQSFWRFDPGASPVGGFSNWLSSDLTFGSPTATVAINDGVTPTSPYTNNTNGVRLVLALSGSTYGGYASTPYIFGARGYTTTQTQNTAGGSVDATPFMAEGLHVEVSDSISGTSGEVEFYNPTMMGAVGIPAIATQTNRPINLIDETSSVVLDGTFNTPKEIYSTVLVGDPGSTSVLERVHGEIKDRWKTADNFMFTEPIPLDGMQLNSAYALLCSVMGLNCNVSASLNYVLPDAGNPTTAHEFNILVKPGDKGSEWLDRLHKTYCGTAFHGISGLDYGAGTPAGTFQLIDPADMPTTPAATLYDGYVNALAGGAPTDGSAYFRSFDMQQIEPEANDIYVVGHDFRQKRPLVYHAPAYASMAAGTAPGSRPDNWLGEPRKYSWIDATLTTIDACQYVGDLLFQRLTQQRQLIEFEAEYQPGLVRGTMVQLVGTRMGTVTARIRSLNLTVEQISNDPTADGFAVWRPVKYVAQIGNDVSALHSYGTTLHQVVQDLRTRSISKNQYITDEDQAKVWARPFLDALHA